MTATPLAVHAADAWSRADPYEAYVGRWSRLVAREFVAWLNVARGRAWLDVGCGTGALSHAILERCAPRVLLGGDRSAAYAAAASARAPEPGAACVALDAQALPVRDGAFEAAVSGLVLNFVPSPARMVAELARAVRRTGVVAVYVWDYGEGMQLMRAFWDAAAELRPTAAELDERRRFPICDPDALGELFARAGLDDVEVRSIVVDTRFRDFDDYWSPFLGGQGPAPGYLASLAEADRAALRELLRERLPVARDLSIPLTARAWAVRARVRG